MRYLPHTSEEIDAMLHDIGAEGLDELFSTVPSCCRRTQPMNLPDPLTEWDLNRRLASLSGSSERTVFAGAGSYEHFIPQVVSSLAGRSEFVTSYTPYQPEISQGTLQGIYEFQSLVCRLFGMEVANGSMYDGASALAEALLMAIRITGKKRVAVSRAVHPHFRQVAGTYLRPTGYELIELPYHSSGKTDLSAMGEMDSLAALAIQSPNFFGCIEDLGSAAASAHRKDALFITSFTEPLAYGLLKNPGVHGADIVCGEGQSLGISQSFGGPGLGILAARSKHVRSMPGRLVGETVDADGRRGYVLTLATREQHIRREKATSNICTNNSLCALTAAMYMSCLGGDGMRELAVLNHDKSEYLKQELQRAGLRVPFLAPTFHEFVVEFPPGFESEYGRLLKKGIVPGLPLSSYYPELAGHYLLCVTETKTREEMDALVKEVRP
ncbi:MAG: aminomethyl-transferring glycine dehydrogenase subunit GcvPA [Desulfobacteraceae bacterium]|nr:MAG: aminomethyl-transferring glycine dehydrogenase subunit GcvPA [Desulfobacteraceae bacterium]